MRIMLGLAAALLWATPATATDWFLLGRSDNTALFVDRDSIEVTGPTMRRAKSFQVFSETDPDGTAAYQPTIDYDCSQPRYRFVSLKSLDIDGNMIAEDKGTGQWRPVDSGSLDSMARKFVCSDGEDADWARSYGAGPVIAPGRAFFEEDVE